MREIAVRRVVARGIDTVVELLLAWSVLGWFVEERGDERVLDPPWAIVALVAIGILIYEVGFLRGFGATPGKILLRLMVQPAGGGTLRWPHALGRVAVPAAVATIFIAVPALNGLVFVALAVLYATALARPRDGRGIVDLVAGTRVVKLAPTPRSGVS